MLVSPKSLSVSSTVDLSSERQKNNRERERGREREKQEGTNRKQFTEIEKELSIIFLMNMVTDEHMVSFQVSYQLSPWCPSPQ